MESISLRQVDSAKRLMLAFPHPDDESFGPGGTIARYVQEGAAVHYVCATRGEVGMVAPEMLKPFEHLPEDQRLGALRAGELRCASDTLGLTGLHFLGYRDSGMAPTTDPRAFVNADPGEVVGRLVKLIRAVRPQVIVTFDPFGGYGHPDHIFIHQCATEAFYAAGESARFPEMGAAYSPQKLYWVTIPKRWVKLIVRAMSLFGRDPTKFGQNQDVDLRKIAEHDYPVTTRIDIQPYYTIKMQASKCHASQGGAGMQLKGFPKFVQRKMLGSETFTLVEPAPNRRRYFERDLFEGISL